MRTSPRGNRDLVLASVSNSVNVVQAEPSMDGSGLVGKMGLYFSAIFLECAWNCDMRDEVAEQ